jgi:hypothetical protein
MVQREGKRAGLSTRNGHNWTDRCTDYPETAAEAGAAAAGHCSGLRELGPLRR